MNEQILTKKSLGQHWLRDEASLLAIALAAKLESSDTVLEIGPGPGSLTSVLVRRAKQVIAVELDQQLASELKQRVPADNLQVVSEDILHFDFSSLPTSYKIVANIPYYLTSNLIRVISESSNPPELAVFLIQKEVAERINAQPGGMSLLSVTTQFFWQVSLGQEVLAKLFVPPPKVDSQILILDHRTKPLFPGIDNREFFKIVRAGFSQRRKTLLNALNAGLAMSRDQVTDICAAAAIDPKRRAQTLSLDEWHQLYLAIHT